VADLQTHDAVIGSSHLRYRNLAKSDVEIRWEIDYRGVSIPDTVTEVVGYLAFESDGLLEALGSGCFSEITLSDQSVDCEEGEYIIVELGPPGSVTKNIKTNIITLPTKGQLYQYIIKDDDFDLSQPIVNPNTQLSDPNGYAVYLAYQTFEGDHEDSFTFQSISLSLPSNIGAVNIHITSWADTQPEETETETETPIPSPVPSSSNIPTPNPMPVPNGGSTGNNQFEPTSTSSLNALTVLVGIAFFLIIIMAIALFAFGFFLYKKENARKEMVSLFLGDRNSTSGESTYFPDQIENNEI